MTRPAANQAGSALVFAMGFMIVVLVVAAGVQQLVLSQLRASGTLRRRVTAEYLAQAGVARTIAWFNRQGYQLPQATALTATVPVKLASSNAPVVLPSNHPSTYVDALGQSQANVVASYNSFATAQGTTAGSFSVVASLIASQPETWELIATGQQGGVQRQVGALLFRQQNTLFSSGLFGSDGVTLNGNAYTDSYDSSIGPYGEKNKFKTGNIGSNSDINLVGNATVNGDAIPGPKGSVSMKGNAEVTGLTDPASSVRTLPPPVIPAGAVDLGAIDLGGNTKKTLTAGTYQISSISIAGNAQLTIDSSAGPINLYVTGTVDIGGNGVFNNSGAPQNLSITQIGGANVSFSGNAAFVGTLYAPDSALSVNGNADLYGSFIGKAMSINGNGGIHYDQFLRTLPGTPGPLKLLAEWMLPSH
jgi:Tfp pilus assembly protein PilX